MRQTGEGQIKDGVFHFEFQDSFGPTEAQTFRHVGRRSSLLHIDISEVAEPRIMDAYGDDIVVPRQELTRRCSEPRASLRLTFCAFAIDASAAWRALPGSRSLILGLVRCCAFLSFSSSQHPCCEPSSHRSGARRWEVRGPSDRITSVELHDVDAAIGCVVHGGAQSQEGG